MANHPHKIPDVSVDEALEMYLSIAFPNGLPEGEDKEKILALMKEKISKDRPEWSKRSTSNDDHAENNEPKDDYASIKAQIVEKANQEEIPEDPEERYFYERRQEAKANSQLKKEEAKETRRDESLRKKLIKEKREDDEVLQKRAALIKKVILERAKKQLSPQFDNSLVADQKKPAPSKESAPVISFRKKPDFSDQNTNEANANAAPLGYEKPIDQSLESTKASKIDSKQWFENFKSLSMEERIESVKAYNLKKREMLQAREEIMGSRHPDKRKEEGFSVDDTFKLDATISLDFNKRTNNDLKLE